MIWLNPWAWLGLAAVAIPIAVHLIGRRRPVRQLFPTLRFLGAADLPPSRRRQLHDPVLLAIRIALVVLAVAALAGPLLLSPARRAAFETTRARAIVVDVSPSMDRTTPGGRPAIDMARERARVLAADASVAEIIERSRLASGIDAASAWLSAQPGRHELLVVSDFQAGALAAADLSAIPSGAAIATERIDVVVERDIRAGVIAVDDRTFNVSLRADDDRTAAAWTLDAKAAPALPLTVVTAESARSAGDAVVRAARTLGVPAGGAARAISVIFPGAPDRDRALSESVPPAEPWMFDAIARLGSHPEFQHSSPGVAGNRRFPVLEFKMRPQTLLVFPQVEVGTPFAAALLAELAWAGSPSIEWAEHEPRFIPDAERLAWERTAGEPSSPEQGPDGPSDGRWLWAAVLALLLVEGQVRRRARVA